MEDRGSPAGTAELCPERLRAVAAAARGSEGPFRIADVRRYDAHTNEVLELRLDDGSALMLKRGRADWSRTLFETSRSAAALLRGSGVLVPEPLPLGAAEDGVALQAYWRIPLPTAASVWPSLDDSARKSAIRSLAGLLGRVHGVRLPGWGGLEGARRAPAPLGAYLERDLGRRLLPAAQGIWPAGSGAVRALAGGAARVAGTHGDGPGRLAHSDLHLDNVLCEVDALGVRCMGLLDLDDAASLPPESDVARFQVLHGPLFGQDIPERWTELLAECYPGPLEPRLLAFFRAFHLANLGFQSALVGDEEHALLVAEALDSEVRVFMDA